MTTLHQSPSRIAGSAEPVPATLSSEKDDVVHEAIVLEDPLDGSMAEEERSRTIASLLIVGAVVLLVSPVGLIIGGPLTFAVDLGCLVTVFLCVRKVRIASRRLAIRGHRAKPTAIWKEALRAEYEGRFKEAAQLYAEIATVFPSTPIAEDAASSIDLLKNEHKIPLDMAP